SWSAAFDVYKRQRKAELQGPDRGREGSDGAEAAGVRGAILSHRHSGAREARTRNPSGRLCRGRMDSGFSPAGCPGMTSELGRTRPCGHTLDVVPANAGTHNPRLPLFLGGPSTRWCGHVLRLYSRQRPKRTAGLHHLLGDDHVVHVHVGRQAPAVGERAVDDAALLGDDEAIVEQVFRQLIRGDEFAPFMRSARQPAQH
ncbi:hypothetical protein SB7C_12185, partial [Staphylococcus epidermidis]